MRLNVDWLANVHPGRPVGPASHRTPSSAWTYWGAGRQRTMLSGGFWFYPLSMLNGAKENRFPRLVPERDFRKMKMFNRNAFEWFDDHENHLKASLRGNHEAALRNSLRPPLASHWWLIDWLNWWSPKTVAFGLWCGRSATFGLHTEGRLDGRLKQRSPVGIGSETRPDTRHYSGLKQVVPGVHGNRFSNRPPDSATVAEIVA